MPGMDRTIIIFLHPCRPISATGTTEGPAVPAAFADPWLDTGLNFCVEDSVEIVLQGESRESTSKRFVQRAPVGWALKAMYELRAIQSGPQRTAHSGSSSIPLARKRKRKRKRAIFNFVCKKTKAVVAVPRIADRQAAASAYCRTTFLSVGRPYKRGHIAASSSTRMRA
ncbi:hypothetical protein VOLCADRAFT_104937 [Volvox carteri f. nagariensis]|uniref:Uncharacterized protein n=1 Tax=Volvox carteri f. nagariensis TaxID=3068 RepID=D8TX94_VOLCA|nr:uncharacterized protein VOLCADRAFT_104937 [Volvox carteri f. nagariensis]EFJ47968.1 hypothetical protein VOLCADRAFT_104937 [Volvox carteri f. nagariensis]|eukprot:XP_002951074.1 hypothetical protein VOLCADRAFT_104937 [Volvox carteri f. nagariensis]